MVRIVALLVLCLSLAGAASTSDLVKPRTTTTTNSALPDFLQPEFTIDTNYRVHSIALGTGKTPTLGREAEVDVVMVHANQ